MAEKDDEYIDYDAMEQHEAELYERQRDTRLATLKECAQIAEEEIMAAVGYGNDAEFNEGYGEAAKFIAREIRKLIEKTNL